MAIGSGTLIRHTAGNFNNAVDGDSLASDQTGASNNAFGNVALSHNVNGSENIVVKIVFSSIAVKAVTLH